MRVAVDLRVLIEPFESGISVYAKAMVLEMQKIKGVELELFYQARERCERVHKMFPKVQHVPISTMWHRMKSLLRFPVLPEGYFKKRPDIIWLPNRKEFYRTDIPVVMTVHDLVPERYGWTMSWKGRVLHKVFSLKRLLKLCDGVLVPTSSVGVSLPRGIKKEVTYEGVELAKKVEVPKRAKQFSKRPFFLTISPADPRKRLEWTIEMARAFPKMNFVIAGMKQGDKRFGRFRVKEAKNLFLLGRVTEREKLWLLRHARALLALSHYEGFDLPILEAVTAKCPVIMSNIAVHNELYRGTFVDSLDDLKAAIYGGAKIAQPRGDYSWESAAKRSLLLFRNVISNKN
jgi:glycosyltransferase involved in cell wall biosynthesis